MLTKQPSAFNKHILIVEDEPHIANLYRDFIAESGYQTTVCYDGQQALALFSDDTSPFHLVLTDQTMPKLSGKALALNILSKHPQLPIIMCTGHNEEIDENLAHEIGIKHFFLKPASLITLINTIDNLLKD